MTEPIFEQTLTELLEHRPFQIFTIELQGGRRLQVDFPLAVSLRVGRAVFQGPGGALHIFDADSTVQFLVGERHALPQS